MDAARGRPCRDAHPPTPPDTCEAHDEACNLCRHLQCKQRRRDGEGGAVARLKIPWLPPPSLFVHRTVRSCIRNWHTNYEVRINNRESLPTFFPFSLSFLRPLNIQLCLLFHQTDTIDIFRRFPVARGQIKEVRHKARTFLHCGIWTTWRYTITRSSSLTVQVASLR